MARIQPKNTVDVAFDTVIEKTASAGVSVGAIYKFTATALKPLSAAINLGTSTLAEHLQAIYAQSLLTNGANLTVGTSAAQDTILIANGLANLTLKSTGQVQRRNGHAAFTSGGEIEEYTAACTTTSTTPVTLFTYTIGATHTQVMVEVHLTSRDNTADTSSFILATISGGRVAGAAVAGTVGSSTATNGTALGTLTVANSGNAILVKVQNVSGTNTTYHLAFIRVIPLSTST